MTPIHNPLDLHVSYLRITGDALTTQVRFAQAMTRTALEASLFPARVFQAALQVEPVTHRVSNGGAPAAKRPAKTPKATPPAPNRGVKAPKSTPVAKSKDDTKPAAPKAAPPVATEKQTTKTRRRAAPNPPAKPVAALKPAARPARAATVAKAPSKAPARRTRAPSTPPVMPTADTPPKSD